LLQPYDNKKYQVDLAIFWHHIHKVALSGGQWPVTITQIKSN
jgi:hypothetical protein